MSTPLRIAVADDERFMRNYYQKTISLLGHEVVAVAENGRQLIERCRATHPDLIITDIRMPDMDGLDATEKIHEESAIPVVLVSAHHGAEFFERAESNHVLAYLIKPVCRSDLAAAVELARHQIEETHRINEHMTS